MSAGTRPAYRGGTLKIAIILYGPKGSGKSRIAQMLAQRLGVHHVDPDTLILELLAHGVEPDPVDGWRPKCTATH
jgi:2-phosphoglycerate kinase